MKFDPVPIIIISVGVIIAAIFAFVGISKSNKDYPSNTNQVKGTPKLELSEKNFYLIPGVKIEQKDVIITNSGDGSLTLSNFTTSSEFITAKLVKTTQISPDFSESNNSGWQTNLDPNSDIILRIEFDRDKFDWDNPTDQFVNFKTNDTKNPTVRIGFLTNPDPNEIDEPTPSASPSSSSKSGSILDQSGD